MKGKYHWAIGHLLLLHTSAEFGDSEIKIEKRNCREYIHTHMDVGYTRTIGRNTRKVRKGRVVHHQGILQANGLLEIQFRYGDTRVNTDGLESHAPLP